MAKKHIKRLIVADKKGHHFLKWKHVISIRAVRSYCIISYFDPMKDRVEEQVTTCAMGHYLCMHSKHLLALSRSVCINPRYLKTITSTGEVYLYKYGLTYQIKGRERRKNIIAQLRQRLG